VNAAIADIAVNSTPPPSGTLDQFSAFWFSQKSGPGDFFSFTPSNLSGEFTWGRFRSLTAMAAFTAMTAL
jgi:hypothetical protein